jgi:hypothetical protein
MPETPIQTPPGFAELSKIEQVRYVQALWNEIAEQEDPRSGEPPEAGRSASATLSGASFLPTAFDVLDRLAKDRK